MIKNGWSQAPHIGPLNSGGDCVLTNVPDSIARVDSTAYFTTQRPGTSQFRLYLCHRLQAFVLLALQRCGITPQTCSPAACMFLLQDVDLDFQYGSDPYYVVNAAIIFEANRLLDRALNWGAFVVLPNSQLAWRTQVMNVHFQNLDTGLSWVFAMRKRITSMQTPENLAQESITMPRTPSMSASP
ncbi:hypothetical protein NM208_g6838 [Fusarium decemcellulare]|uniref:Uncharacterized protein n=1 Tax=Fusarium decemcellulare TaxID=57161 RepID=A0ACC1SBM3_9HYPO|nr:hypothetical protein NM208_g6838 [Fusarium decemcellulare]